MYLGVLSALRRGILGRIDVKRVKALVLESSGAHLDVEQQLVLERAGGWRALEGPARTRVGVDSVR